MNAIEKCLLRDITYRMSLERNKMSRDQPEYKKYDKFIKQIMQVVDPDPSKRRLDFDHEHIIDWINERYSLNISELARYISYDIDTLRAALHRRKYKGGKYTRKIPKNKLPLVVEYISQYGYAEEVKKAQEALS